VTDPVKHRLWAVRVNVTLGWGRAMTSVTINRTISAATSDDAHVKMLAWCRTKLNLGLMLDDANARINIDTRMEQE
jgi:hypothetical protein